MKVSTLKATIGAVPTPQEPKRVSSASGSAQPGTAGLGLAVRVLPQAARSELRLDYGLVVEGISGPNADAPLRRGDIVVAVNNQRFNSLDEFKRQVAEAAPGENVALLVRRGDASVYVPLVVARP